jgi:subtilisin family serine protease
MRAAVSRVDAPALAPPQRPPRDSGALASRPRALRSQPRAAPPADGTIAPPATTPSPPRRRAAAPPGGVSPRKPSAARRLATPPNRDTTAARRDDPGVSRWAAALELVGLERLAGVSHGTPEIRVGLIDGPVNTAHAALTSARIVPVGAARAASCRVVDSAACRHGTAVAGFLVAAGRDAAAGVCPGCTLLVRPVFAEAAAAPESSPAELARALRDIVDAGAHVINVSAGLIRARGRLRDIEEAVEYAAGREVPVVVAGGNTRQIGASSLTGHPWTTPVVAYDLRGRPLPESSLGRSIGGRGLGACGEPLPTIAGNGRPMLMGGTSTAAPFVTGALALLRAAFPSSGGAHVRHALVAGARGRRSTVIPPLMDAWGGFEVLDVDRPQRR